MVVLQAAELRPHVLHLLLKLRLCQVCLINHFVQRADLLLHCPTERLLVLEPAGGAAVTMPAADGPGS